MANTFATLKTRLQSYRKGDDLTSFWPDLIAQAEERIFEDLDVTEEEVTFEGDITSGELTLPADFSRQRSLYLDAYEVQPKYRTPQVFWEDTRAYTQPGRPAIYTVEARTLKVWPLPDKDPVNAVITYVSFPAPLTQDEDTNDILERHFSVYLYGTLIETEMFVGNDPRALTWATAYDEAVQRKNMHANRQRYPSGGIAVNQQATRQRRSWPTARSSNGTP